MVDGATYHIRIRTYYYCFFSSKLCLQHRDESTFIPSCVCNIVMKTRRDDAVHHFRAGLIQQINTSTKILKFCITYSIILLHIHRRTFPHRHNTIIMSVNAQARLRRRTCGPTCVYLNSKTSIWASSQSTRTTQYTRTKYTTSSRQT